MSRKPDGANRKKYLTVAGAWALAFGCSVGWGSFVMPGTTFLPMAGPAGTALGIAFGGLVMLILAKNYHFLMNRHSDGGGTYTYTKKCFGHDHGFVNAWFLILTYIAIIWANSTALPLIARTVLGNTFLFGFEYEIAGYHVWFGEILLAEIALASAAAVCLFRKTAERMQILMAVLLFGGIVFCFAAAAGKQAGNEQVFVPAYAPDHSAAGGIFTIFALAPWAFVGFESISHSAAEARFPLKRSFRIMAAAVSAAAAAYILLALLAATAWPEGCGSWADYIGHLESYGGTAAQPVFYAAEKAVGPAGITILGVAALCAIYTGLIGNYISLSRLLESLSEDKMLPEWIGEEDKHYVPRKAVLGILAVSAVLPFLGRTAISWIVDVTTVGATIAYVFTSASAWKTAKQEKNRTMMAVGIAGIIASLLFAVEFLVPNLTPVSALSTESYLILALWSIAGFLYFRFFLKKGRDRRLGRSIVAWVVLLGLIIFTSSVWMRQTTDKALDAAARDIAEITDGNGQEVLRAELEPAENALRTSSLIQIGLIVAALAILLEIYSFMQKREKKTEVEKALAEETSKAKTSFLHNMSHEIRTPMNAIIGLDNIALRDPELTPKTRENLEKINLSAKHLLGVINDILDMSKIESGRIQLRTEEFSFREFLEQINIIIGGQCQDKGLVYNHSVSGPVRDYYIGDDMKLKQVLINILGNSVKFTDVPGTVTFTAEQTSEEGEDAVFRFTMRDTGIGMDPEFIPKLFEAFSQEDATTTNRYGGTGLGMAISKSYAEMMGGNIRVESKKGVGSVFTVTVVLKKSGRTAETDRKTAEAQSPVQPLAGKRVLMAEDVEQNAEILADLLDLEDILSEHAVNGEEAVRMFSEHPPGYYDVILMDVRMPVMDGLSATRAIRALERPDAGTVPIIAMTANVFEEDTERSLEAGMNAHLSKPIVPGIMYETMARLIAESRGT